MVSMRVTIQDLEVKKALATMVAKADDLTPVMDIIGDAMVASTLDRFRRGVAPDGTAWKPSIRALTQGGQTLVDSGHLRDSIVHAPDAKGVEWGTNVIYAAVHQLGATIRAKTAGLLKFKIGDRFVSKESVTIPARPFLGVSADDEAEINNILGDYFLGAAG